MSTRVSRILLPALSFLCVATAAIGAAAAQDSSAGEQIARHGTASGVMPCTICHGPQLQGSAAMGAPPLAGAPQTQTLSALTEIAEGKIGTNDTMRQEARLLTPPQRTAIADYLRSLTNKSITLQAIPPNGEEPAGIAKLSMGADIVQFGTASGVKACTTCHGDILQGSTSAGAPPLAGQPKAKTLAVLDEMAAGKPGKSDAMGKIARLLSRAQREAVAAYVERVTPVKPAHSAAAPPHAR